jgi:surfactin synthase thioesterase subunit
MPDTVADSARWIRRFHPATGSGARVVCFPHAGSSASFYFPVSRTLAPEIEVVAIQYPGRQDRRLEPCIDDAGRYADAVTAALLADGVDRDLVFFGHSLGALLAFEVTRRLEAGGTKVRHLIASGRMAPSRHRDDRVHERGDEGLLAEMRSLSGTDQKVLADPELLRMILPALRGDYRAAETYRQSPDAAVDCPITVLVGDTDPKVDAAEAADWSRHTRGGFELRTFPGGHFYLLHHQNEINELLAKTAR